MGCISSKKRYISKNSINNLLNEQDKETYRTASFVRAAWYATNPILTEESKVEMETMLFVYMIEGVRNEINIPFIDA